MVDVLAWYVGFQAVALAAWPLVARACGPLDDRGWGLSKIAGLLVWAWLAWLVSMLAPIPYTRPVLLVELAAVAFASWLAARRFAPLGAGLGEPGWLRQRWRLLLAEEAGLLGALGFYLLLRAHDPAITGTEKPMDMAFLNGFVAAQRLPTQDTWLAGYGVPYYYFYFFLFASLVKLSGVSAAVGYNLAAATVPALAAVGLGSLAWNVSRAANAPARWAALAGLLAPTLTLLGGNFSTPLEFLVSRGVLTRDQGAALGIKAFADGVLPGMWPPGGAWWWRAARVAPNIQPDGINEFPFFSALLSDLHPHFMALALEPLVLGVILCHLVSQGATTRSAWTQGLAALGLGSLLVGNTWDVAPFGLLYVGAAWLSVGALAWPARAARALLAPGIALLLFAPYFVGYAAPPLGVDLVRERTYPSTLLVLLGSQLVLLLLLGALLRARSSDSRVWAAPLVSAAAGLLLVVAGEPSLGLLVWVAGMVLPWPWLFERLSPPERYLLLLGGFAAAILIGVELIYLRDTFGSRMNTVFKFHYNAWLLATFAGAAGFGLLGRMRAPWRWALLAVGGLVATAMLVYPVSATMTRFQSAPPTGFTLDGSRFLPPDERAAVEWLRDQTDRGRPITVEAVGGAYSAGARMATYSGGVTVLGWPGHELQWRGPNPEFGRREADVARLYRSGDAATILEVSRRYRADFVILGNLERQQYGPGIDLRLDALLPVAFRSGSVTVYRAPR